MKIEDCLMLHDNKPFSLIFETSIATTNCAFNIMNYLINVDIIPKMSEELIEQTFEKCFIENQNIDFIETIKKMHEQNINKIRKSIGKCILDINDNLFIHNSLDFIKRKRIEFIKDFNSFFIINNSEKIECKLLLSKELRLEQLLPIFNKILKI